MSSNFNATHSFKSSSREILPSWSNRTRKDVHDLIYNAKDLRDIEYVRKSSNNSKSQKKQGKSSGYSPMKIAAQKYISTNKPISINQQNSRKPSTSNSPTRSNKMLRSSSNQNLNPQLSGLKKSIYKNESLLRSTDSFMKRSQSTATFGVKNQTFHPSNNYGLCQFEFSNKTIEGKIHSKYRHSLDFSKSRTQKVNFAQTIYYDKTEDIVLHELEKRKMIDTLKKYRNFKTYTSHKLYAVNTQTGNGGHRDKFYDVTMKELDLIRKKCSLDSNFDKMIPRSGLLKKLGTNLEYPDYHTSIAQTNTHRPLYDIQRLQRNLVISKQVISDRRGCYR